MTLYEAYASDLAEAIAAGVFRPGDRLPSVREACRQRGVSPATVFKAYYLLEAEGLIRAAPRSGYYVNPRPSDRRLPEPKSPRPKAVGITVSTDDLVYDILASLKQRSGVPLGSPFIDPTLFPLERLRHSLAAAMRRLDPWSTVEDLPPGNRRLKRHILKRYLAHRTKLAESEIVLTHGALPALNLCLAAVTKPGDAVVIESPTFYVALQALQRRSLKAIEVATDCREGIDLGRLAQVLEKRRPAACWLMTNFQNPLGSLMPDRKKRDLVALLARHEVPLIEDDVYGELYQGDTAPPSAKSFDRRGLVMHCACFSKTLAPGYRVGWTAAGRFAAQVERLKLMTLLTGAIPTQAAGRHLPAGRGLRLASPAPAPIARRPAGRSGRGGAPALPRRDPSLAAARRLLHLARVREAGRCGRPVLGGNGARRLDRARADVLGARRVQALHPPQHRPGLEPPGRGRHRPHLPPGGAADV
jgi:DNA-binding transcriptional MocR family regulator